MPVVYVRNALVAIGTTLPNATAQILRLRMLMMSSWLLLGYTMAHRIKIGNHLDAARHLFFPMVVSSAAFYADHIEAVSIGVSAFVFVGVSTTLLLGGMLFTCGQRMLNALKRAFAHFLCHHKAGAGAMPRLLKMRLQEMWTGAVWPDSDGLRDLASLFDWVVQSLEQLCCGCARLLLAAGLEISAS